MSRITGKESLQGIWKPEIQETCMLSGFLRGFLICLYSPGARRQLLSRATTPARLGPTNPLAELQGNIAGSLDYARDDR